MKGTWPGSSPRSARRLQVPHIETLITHCLNSDFQVGTDYTTLRDYQKLCLQKYIQRDYVEQLLKYSDKQELYNQLKSWVKPNFPIRGNALAEHGLKGIRLGLVMDELKLLWADSDFQLSHDDLVKKIPDVLEKIPSSPSKVKSMK